MLYQKVSDKTLATKQPLTNSIMSDFLQCARRGYYQIVCNLKRAETPALRMGSIVHEGIEKQDPDIADEYYDLDEATHQQEYDSKVKELCIVKELIKGALEHWFNNGNEVLIAEMEFALPIINPKSGYKSRTFYLAGKIDGLEIDERGKIWLIEYKTTGQSIDRRYVDKLDLDMQATIYYYAAEKYVRETYDQSLEGILYRVMRKPSIRQRQHETLYDYIERLQHDYATRPDFYFSEIAVPRKQKDLTQFQQHLWECTLMLMYMRRNNIWPMNTAACNDFGGCDFKPLCLQVPDAEYTFEKGGLIDELGLLNQTNITMEGGDPFDDNVTD